MIYFVGEHNCWVISSGGMWLPGSFATKGAAHLAFRLNDKNLAALNAKINIAEKKDITLADVQSALKEQNA